MDSLTFSHDTSPTRNTPLSPSATSPRTRSPKAKPERVIKRQEETEKLLNQASYQSTKKVRGSLNALDGAIAGTQDAKKRLKQAFQNVTSETKRAMTESRKTGEARSAYAMEHEASVAMCEYWSDRPSRYQEADEVKRALDVQTEELENTLGEIDEYATVLRGMVSSQRFVSPIYSCIPL